MRSPNHRSSIVDHRFSSGFTLIELLVVVTIVALLLAMLLPSLGKAKEMAGRVSCMSTIRQLGMGAFMYAGDNRSVLGPPNNGPAFAGGSMSGRTFVLVAGQQSGQPWAIHPQSYWIMGSYVSGPAYLCPAIGSTFDPSGVVTDDGVTNMRTRVLNWRPGSPPAHLWMVSNYSFNVAAVTNMASKVEMPWHNGGVSPTPLSKARSDWPLLCDTRVVAFQAAWSITNHYSRGYNVFYADGATLWIDRVGAVDPIEDTVWADPNATALGAWPIWTFFSQQR